MNSSLQFTLSLDFPGFFRYMNNHDIEIGRVVIAERGIQTGDGWYKIIRDLATAGELVPGMRALQITTKNGILRVRNDPIINDDYRLVLKFAVALSAITCDCCGNPGKIRDTQMNGVARRAVRCEEHAQYLELVSA